MAHVCAECGGQVIVEVHFELDIELGVDPETGEVEIERSDFDPRTMYHEIYRAYCEDCNRDVDVGAYMEFRAGTAFANVTESPAEEEVHEDQSRD